MSWMKKSEMEGNAMSSSSGAAMNTPQQAMSMPAAPPRREAISTVVNVGKSVEIRGELTGDEDRMIEGRVEGQIRLPKHKLTIGASARIDAEVSAKTVLVLGSVKGNISAEDSVDIHASGSVEGDIASPRVSIADGARFQGRIDMQERTAQAPAEKERSPKQHERAKADMAMAG